MANFSIGVDLGGTNLRIAGVSDQGQILESINTTTECSRGRDMVIDEMCAAIQSLAAKLQQQMNLVGIGIGVPGIIDMKTGMLRESPNLPGWNDYPVREEIEGRLRTRVVLENDANAAALGEFWIGAGREVDNMCMLTLGTGVGGGIIWQEKIWHGMTGMAGELGHITVFPDGNPCGCGAIGCLEQYASATAIKRMAMEKIATGEAPELAAALSKNPELTSKHIYELAMTGDRTAQEVFEKAGEALGIALTGLVNIFNFPMYVIGGGAAAGWDAFAPRMLEVVSTRSFVHRATNGAGGQPASGQPTRIVRAMLGGDAGLIGSARLPMLAHIAVER